MGPNGVSNGVKFEIVEEKHPPRIHLLIADPLFIVRNLPIVAWFPHFRLGDKSEIKFWLNFLQFDFYKMAWLATRDWVDANNLDSLIHDFNLQIPFCQGPLPEFDFWGSLPVTNKKAEHAHASVGMEPVV